VAGRGQCGGSLALGLLTVGAGLSLRSVGAHARGLFVASLPKLVLSPLLVWAIGRWIGLDPVALSVAVVFAAQPAATSSYILARRLGGDAALIGAILDMFERKSADVFERQIRALIGRPDGEPVLRSLGVPTLVLTGRQDSWASVEQHRALHARVAPAAQAVLEIIEEAGHMVPMERPAELAAALLRWLARHIA
jgi:pimeloyl-ACP methyl ester carboxylesterase